jgi:hypothetical protein
MKKLMLAMGVAAGLCGAAWAVTGQVTAGERTSLFDGTSLTGWKVLRCEAAVTNGMILIKDGNGLVQSEKTYGDFVFECEWKALKPDKWDSGIYFRYDPNLVGKPWPKRYQANLKQGDEGNVSGLNGATSKGLFKAHDWNTLKLTVHGTHAELEVNGKLAWKADGLGSVADSHIALQAEVPNGGQHLFKNIFITELK